MSRGFSKEIPLVFIFCQRLYFISNESIPFETASLAAITRSVTFWIEV